MGSQKCESLTFGKVDNFVLLSYIFHLDRGDICVHSLNKYVSGAYFVLQIIPGAEDGARSPGDNSLTQKIAKSLHRRVSLTKLCLGLVRS